MTEIRQESTSEERPHKTAVDAVWSANENGDLVLTIPNGLTVLRHDALILSASGKTASPMTLTVPRFYVERDGSEVEYRARVSIEVPIAAASPKTQRF